LTNKTEKIKANGRKGSVGIGDTIGEHHYQYTKGTASVYGQSKGGF
jgi:hypothetical protein